MNNATKIKILIFTVVIFFIGLSIRIGFTDYFPAQQERDKNPIATASMLDALASPQNSAVLSVTEIPSGRKPKVPETLAAQASVVINLSSGEKVFGLREQDRWPMASVVKLMSSIVALENMDKEQRIIISPTAIEALGAAGRFTAGDSYSVQDLVSTMMVVSSNDAAVALAENMPAHQFVYLMNQKATAIGMNNTRFHEPTGLSALNQSTANDLAIFIRYAWNAFPDLFSISARESMVIRELNLNQSVRLNNINPLAARNDFLGGKTGTTLDANQNLIAIFSISGENFAIIILGADDRIKETKKIIYHINNVSNASH